MPLPFEELQGKGVFDFSSSSSSSCSEPILHRQKFATGEEESAAAAVADLCYAGGAISEPTSVLDSVRRSPSPLTTSSSTVSSSHGGTTGGGGGAAASSTAVSGKATTTAATATEEKCGHMNVDEWDNVLSAGSPSHEHNILRLIMGDVEDPSIGLNKILQTSTGFQSLQYPELNSTIGFGAMDPGFGLEPVSLPADSLCSSTAFPVDVAPNANPLFSSAPPPLFSHPQTSIVETLEEKPQILNPQVVINQNQAHFTQGPAMFMPVQYGQFQEHQTHFQAAAPPPAKRMNPGPMGFGPGFNPAQRISTFPDSPRPGFNKPAAMTMAAHQQIQQQAILDQIFKAAELIESGGDPSSILARLNQQLSSPTGKPFQRAAFYFKEALQKLILNLSSSTTAINASSQAFSSYSLIFKIGAYKSFSEISPILQFANFTSNQALLESFQDFDRVHIIDFDIGYGGQWASLMQELFLRNGGAPSLKLTVFAFPATQDELELGFTQENLKHFASEINISLEIEVLSLDHLNSISWHSSEKEAVAVNLSVASFSNIPSYLPSVLRFVKQISPRILVCSDRGCERTDLPFPQQLIHSLQSHTALLESLDAVNANHDSMQKIERFLIQPSIEKTVVNRSSSSRSPAMDRTVPWRAMFLQMGFSPLIYSNFTESQADCLVQRTPVRGFHVEKKQNSLVLCWQRKELVGVSAWTCCS